MKGFKAFGKGLICRNYQFEEGKVFEEEKAEICNSGFHYCVNPLDTLDYYPLIDDNGDLTEFAEVEALEDPQTDDNKKYCTKKIKIGAKLSLNGFITAGFDYIKESCKVTADTTDGKKITRKKDGAQVATSGYSSKVATSGDSSKVATSGDYSQVATSGYSSKVATSGYSSKVATSGDYSKVATSGNSSQVATSGYFSKVATSGNYSKVATSGDYSQVATSGYYSKVAINGANSVGANIGINGVIKGKKGCWITLAEYDNRYNPICVKSAQIDGVKIKENTYYRLKNGEFVEA